MKRMFLQTIEIHFAPTEISSINTLVTKIELLNYLQGIITGITEIHTEDGICYYCGEKTESLSGNPSRWPIQFCHHDNPGVSKFHHTGCVQKRMIEDFEFEVGERVHDDLTKMEATVIGITYENGQVRGDKLRSALHTVGYWVDNDYLAGGRHPWELTKIRICPWEECYLSREKREPGPCSWSIRDEKGEADCGYG